MANPTGRPMKYIPFFLILKDDEVYTPAKIFEIGEKYGLTKLYPNEDGKLRLRVRHTLARFTKNHGFPDEGDGMVKMKGQPCTPGWFGWRWKSSLPKNTDEKAIIEKTEKALAELWITRS